jgi:hypothetical protein
MTSSASDQSLAFLAQHLDARANSAQLARLVSRVCQEIDLALTPIVGQRGVAALFARSLQLSAKSHPWLSGAGGGNGTTSSQDKDGSRASVPVEFSASALRGVIAQQSQAEAVAGSCLLLQTFCDLLAKLVGRALTERLLRTPWITFLSGTAAQDDTQ